MEAPKFYWLISTAKGNLRRVDEPRIREKLERVVAGLLGESQVSTDRSKNQERSIASLRTVEPRILLIRWRVQKNWRHWIQRFLCFVFFRQV